MDTKIKEVLDQGKNIFLTGPGGTGKSYQTQRIVEYLNENVSVAAPTGAAAIQVGGVTLHSLLGQGLFLGSVENLIEKMKRIRGGANDKDSPLSRWCVMDTLLLDEVSMVDVSLFVRASKVIQAIRRDVYENPHNYNNIRVSRLSNLSKDEVEKRLSSPWGGIRLILVGDFLQLPPIQPYVEQIGVRTEKDIHGNEVQVPVTKSYRYLFEHPIWQEMNLTTIYLTEPKRFQGADISDEESSDYFNILSDIRLGILSDRVRNFMNECSKKPQAKRFPSLDDLSTTGATIIPTVLIATNKEVDKHNSDQLSKLPGKEYIYHAVFRCNSRTSVSKEDMVRSCLAPDPLVLKVGAQVMLLVNKLDLGLCNGSRGVVVGFREGSNNPIVQFMNGKVITIDPHTWSCSARMKSDEKCRASLIQIPLRLAYALSVHKSQGQNCDSVWLSMDTCFESSQIYVALSRCKDRRYLFIKGWSEQVWNKCLPDRRAIEFYQNLQSSTL